MSKKRALAVFSSDALSSVAYATEEILLVLMLAGTAALSISIPVSLAIVGLLVIVVVSYRQTIYEYPNGGGAYVVAKENLGETAGLVAGAALLIDYILTVAVSVAAGIAAITSAFPVLFGYNVELSIIAIGIVTVMNLRGIRESAKIFGVPTYAFIFGIIAMVVIGFYELLQGKFERIAAPQIATIQQPLTLFLILRAFSSGCTAMTGVEAVSNGVPIFNAPESRNASITLIVMTGILAFMFFGIGFLSHYHGIVPLAHETVLSQLARSVFGTSFFYYFIQFMTMGILVLAANTSFNGFPRLASLLARDRFLPRQFASLGDRLVFSNGVIMLGVISAILIVIFRASTHALIPLYAVGVFLSFTLSQWGMVKHQLRFKKPLWIGRIFLNGLGGSLTAVVTVIFIVTKFNQGAWVIALLLPAFIVLFREIQGHYLSVGRQLSLIGIEPQQVNNNGYSHTVLLPISGIHKGVIEALYYAKSIAPDIRAVYVEIDEVASLKLQEEWQKWAKDVPLVVLKSPYRSVMTPFLRYVEEVKMGNPNTFVTIIIPEFVTAKWWQQLLHNQTAFLIRAALIFKRGLVVTSVRYHLEA